jgi:hypothetical protein
LTFQKGYIRLIKIRMLLGLEHEKYRQAGIQCLWPGSTFGLFPPNSSRAGTPQEHRAKQPAVGRLLIWSVIHHEN